MVMKHVLIAALLATVLASNGYCQDRIYPVSYTHLTLPTIYSV